MMNHKMSRMRHGMISGNVKTLDSNAKLPGQFGQSVCGGTGRLTVFSLPVGRTPFCSQGLGRRHRLWGGKSHSPSRGLRKQCSEHLQLLPSNWELLGWAGFTVASGFLCAPGADRMLARNQEVISPCGFLFPAVLNLEASSITFFSENGRRVTEMRVVEREELKKRVCLRVVLSYRATEGARGYAGLWAGCYGSPQQRGNVLQHFPCKARR